jgi:formiminotetrahydrofolate cyclodeaminase
VNVLGSEIVGLIPRRALEDVAVQHLKVENYRPELIVENRLAEVLAQKASPAAPAAEVNLRGLAEGFVAAVACATPTPGGGSVAALAGALAAALGEMVAGLTLKRKSSETHHTVLNESLEQLTRARAKLLENIDRDAVSYQAVIAAFKLPKTTQTEQAARAQAIEEASKAAALVPLETAELCVEAGRIVNALRPISLSQAASDLTVALHLAEAGRKSALENVHANLPSIEDRDWVARITDQARKLEALATPPPTRSK